MVTLCIQVSRGLTWNEGWATAVANPSHSRQKATAATRGPLPFRIRVFIATSGMTWATALGNSLLGYGLHTNELDGRAKKKRQRAATTRCIRAARRRATINETACVRGPCGRHRMSCYNPAPSQQKFPVVF